MCTLLQAQYAGIAGNWEVVGAAIRRLRQLDGTIEFPFKAIPARPEWDAVRVAHFDTMRHFRGPLWDTRGHDEMAHRVGHSFLGQYLKAIQQPLSDEARAAMERIYQYEMAHNNLIKAGLWPNMYAIAVEIEIEK